MAVSIKHTFVSPVVDQGNPDEVGPDEWNDEHTVTGLGTAAEAATTDFATAAQGGKADTAVQPGNLATVATTGAYSDLSGKPTLGTAAAENVGYFATAAQGALADSATQPGDLATVATTGDFNDLINAPGGLSDGDKGDVVVSSSGAVWEFDSSVVTAFSKSFLSAANEAGFKAAVNLEIGVDVQAYSANLAEWSGINPSSDGGSLVAAADYAAMRTLLGLVIGTNVQAYDADLTAWAAVNPSSYSTTAQIAAAYQPLDSDLTSWASVTRASGFDTFAATPSSANLRALLSDEAGTGAAYFVGGALGTPSSATLTNASGLPVSGITASTSTALGVGSVELGHATDTTLSRGAAGFLAVEGKRVPSPASQAAGDTLYRGSTEWERLALGTAGQVLTVNAGATAPEWQTASGGGGQPIPTSSTFAVGTLILAFNGSASSVASGGTLAGSDTRRLAVSSGTVGFGPAMTGTYTNYHGASVATNNCGYFARTA